MLWRIAFRVDDKDNPGTMMFSLYLEDGKTIEGIFNLVEQKENYVKIESDHNEITIPYHKINKIKIKKMKGGKK